MSEDFDREERAFSDAFRNAVAGESFRPLDPAGITAGAGRPRRPAGPWLKGLAAAATVVVAVSLGVALAPRLGGAATPASGTVAAAPEEAGGAAPMDAQRSGEQPADLSSLPPGSEWQAVPAAPLSPRSNASGAWLDGRFYLVGGQLDQPCPPNADCLAPSRLLRDGASYDPAAGTWRAIAPAPVDIAEAPPVASAGSLYFRVTVDGVPTLYAYDTSADTWSTVPSPRQDGQLVATPAGLASIPFSDEERGVVDELYDPATRTWTGLPDDPLGRSYDRRAVWVGGKLLLLAKKIVAAAGAEKAPVVRLAELDLTSMSWRRLPDSTVIGSGAVVAGGLVVLPDTGSADGGEVNNWGRSYPMGGIYDPGAGEWRELPPVAGLGEGVRQVWSETSVAGDRVLASGHLLDPRAGSWTALAPPLGANLQGQTVVAGPDGILAFGGWDGSAQTSRVTYLPLR